MKNIKEKFRLITIVLIALISVNTSLKAQENIYGLHYFDHLPVSLEISDGKIMQKTPLHKLHEGSPRFYIAPAFDNQVNGFAGVSFAFGDSDLTPEGIEKATSELWKKGVSTYLSTLTTNSIEVLTWNFEILSKVVDDKKLLGSIPGFHLEGPYINPDDDCRRAHPKQFVKLPDWDEFMQLYKASEENILQVTLAPEMKGGLDVVTKCSQKGIVVALGHHIASAQTVTEAIDRGTKIAAHLGNLAANMINRHNNPFWSQLTDDRFHISIIGDSFQLLPEEIQTFYNVKSVEKTIITSDVTHYAAQEPGEYKTSTGETIELTEGGMLCYPAQNVLCASASPITKGVGYVMQVTGCSLAETIQMASTDPARLYNLNDHGTLELGKRADIVLFTLGEFEVNIKKTWVKGELVYENR